VDADVAILGGGPAGAAMGIALRRHAPQLRVLLIDRASGDGRRIGETLPPGVRPVLEQLGLWSSFLQQRHLPAYGVKTAWGGGRLVDRSFMMAARGDGWHLDRRRFDQLLLDEARLSGVQVVRPGRLAAAERTERGWSLSIRAAGSRQSAQVGMVADASGRSAWFARRYGGAVTVGCDRLVAAFQFFECPDGVARDTQTLTEPVEHGYWYAAAIPNGQRQGLAAAMMTDADLVNAAEIGTDAGWRRAISGAEFCRQLTSGLRPAGSVRTIRAESQLLEPASGDDWVAVGDAASTFDPLSSLGIFKALRSGLFAAYAVADQLAGDSAGMRRYRRFVTGGFRQYLETRRKFYCSEPRWQEAPFWQRRRAAIALRPATELAPQGQAGGPG